MMHASLLKAVRGCAALPGIGSTTGAAAIASLHHPTIASSDEASANRFVYVHTGNIKLEPSSTRFMLPGPLRQSPPLSVPPFQQQAYSSTTGHSSVHDELLAAGERHSVDDVLSFVERCGEGMSEEDVEVALGLLARSAQELSEEEQAELGWKLQGSKTFQAVLDMVCNGAERFSPAQQARMLGALGALRYSHQLVVDMISRNLVADVGRLPAAELQQLALGLRQLDLSPGVLLLDAIKARLPEVDLPEGSVREVEEALGRLGHDEVPPADMAEGGIGTASGRGEATGQPDRSSKLDYV